MHIQVAQKCCDVKHLIAHDHPAVAVLVVLSHLLSTDGHPQNSGGNWQEQVLWKRSGPKCIVDACIDGGFLMLQLRVRMPTLS